MIPSLPMEMDSNGQLPNIIHGYVSVTSQGGQSPFQMARDTLTSSSDPFQASDDNRAEARRALESIGFEVIAESRLGMAIAGPPGAYEELTGGTVVTKERLLRASAGQQRYVTHIDIVGENQPSNLGRGNVPNSSAQIEGVLIERPKQYHAVFPAPIPPSIDVSTLGCLMMLP